MDLKGNSVLADKSKLCAVLEDLSPQLMEEREFIEKVYSNPVGTLFFKASEAKGAEKKSYLTEIDFYLEEQNGYNEKWRKRLFLYFHELFLDTAVTPAVSKVSEQTAMQDDLFSNKVHFMILNRCIVDGKIEKVQHKKECAAGDVITGEQISKELPAAPIFKVLYNERLKKIGIKNLTDYEWEIVSGNYVHTKCMPGQVQVLEKEMMVRIKPRIAQLYVTAVQLQK